MIRFRGMAESSIAATAFVAFGAGVIAALAATGAVSPSTKRRRSSEPERDPNDNAEQAHIRRLAQRYAKPGNDVWAAVRGWRHPPKTCGRIADLMVRFRNGRIKIIEAENPTSVKRDHFRKQDAAYRRWMVAAPFRSYEVHVVDGCDITMIEMKVVNR